MEGRIGGGETRRVHVIYFLSRTGHVEQPHLIRVHHLHRNGVRLRDVKRWLSDLRGKDMPDSFAWSYKRRYRKGYVWQDLLDDHLITPISDNEFVLKGSEIVPADYYLYGENRVSVTKQTQTSTEASPAFGSVTDDSTKYEEDKAVVDDKSNVPSSAISASPTSENRKSNGNGNGGGRGSLFRNLLTCGGAETNDSVSFTRRHNNGEICRDEKLGGSVRVVGTSWNHSEEKHQNARRSCDGGVNKETDVVNYKKKPCTALHAPTCSQCGKAFKPEKMHKHMKSCRGIKGNEASLAKPTPIHSALTHFLTN